MSHCDTHEGCPNKAYADLPMDEGDAALSVEDAKKKAPGLLSKALPQNPTEDDVCSLLHEFACLLHASGTGNQVVNWVASFGQSVSKGLATSAKELDEITTAILNKILKWLQVYIDADNLACIQDRMEHIEAGGIREGDATLWMDCLRAPTKTGANSATTNEIPSLLSLFTQAAESGYLSPASEGKFPFLVIDPENPESVEEAKRTIYVLLSQQRSREQTSRPPSTAGSRVVSKSAPTG